MDYSLNLLILVGEVFLFILSIRSILDYILSSLINYGLDVLGFFDNKLLVCYGISYSEHIFPFTFIVGLQLLNYQNNNAIPLLFA